MPAISRIASLVLRFLELVSAAVVAGIIGKNLRYADKVNGRPAKRMIYTEVVAGLSLLVAIILMLPMTFAFSLWPLDIILFILWIVAFGLLQDWLGPLKCSAGWQFNPWAGDDMVDSCQQLKAALAFSFLSAIFWLASGIIAAWALYRIRGKGADAHVAPRRRGFWNRRRV